MTAYDTPYDRSLGKLRVKMCQSLSGVDTLLQAGIEYDLPEDIAKNLIRQDLATKSCCQPADVEPYDSRPDTVEHINLVGRLIVHVVRDLLERARVHDQSKLADPEKATFDEYTPKLKGSTYGSDEYKGFLAGMKPALDHHYAANSHHPEHFTGSTCAQCGNREDQPCTCGGPRVSTAGIRGMNLLDLVEMFCDWKAATTRHADGDLRKSIDINQKRFGYSDDLKAILRNTVALFEPPPEGGL